MKQTAQYNSLKILFLGWLFSLCIFPLMVSQVFAQTKLEKTYDSRVVLCGKVLTKTTPSANLWILEVPLKSGNQEFQIRSDEGAPTETGACAAFRFLPENTNSGTVFSAYKQQQGASILEVLNSPFLYPIKVCGKLEWDGEEAYLSIPQRVYLKFHSKKSLAIKKGPAHDTTFCAGSMEFPVQRTAIGQSDQSSPKAWELDVHQFKNDWQKSGFSVGNF